jgi:hypothetical protein
MADFGADVVGQDGSESGLVRNRRDPAGELRVPDGVVATDQLVVSLGPVDEVVTWTEVEVATRRLNGVPVHTFLTVNKEQREGGKAYEFSGVTQPKFAWMIAAFWPLVKRP